MAETTILDEAIRIVVSPSQSSYFAGETFSVTVTITNLRTPQANLPPRSASQSYSHKRGAHSVSYVPMARPPTSPGVRTTSGTTSVRQSAEKGFPMKQGIVGRKNLRHNVDVLPGISEAIRRRQLEKKSLSVSISLQGPQVDTIQETKDTSPLRIRRELDTCPTPSSPRVSSPLARSVTLPLRHPHARKDSVLLDGEAVVRDERVPPQLPTPNASTSTFSLSLDPITENASSPFPPATPAVPSPYPNGSLPSYRTRAIVSSTSAESVLDPKSRISIRGDGIRKPPQLALGNNRAAKGPPSRRILSSSFSVPHSELILYSYAQLVGTLTVAPLPHSQLTQEQRHTLYAVRNTLAKAKGVGGGSMDITAHTPHSLPHGHQMLSTSRWTSRSQASRSTPLSAGLFSLLSPTSISLPSSPTSPTQSWVPSHRSRSSSIFSSLFSGNSSAASSPLTGLGLVLNNSTEYNVDPDTPLPTFEVQPKMLAVDLTLAPGESRCYTYQLNLPRNLPPSYRGRCLKFSYEFILGVCRASPQSMNGAASNSRVLKVPIRVYNHAVVDQPPTPYDLLWPMHSHRQPINVRIIEVSPDAKSIPPALSSASHGSRSTGRGLRAYAEDLLQIARTSGHSSTAHDFDEFATGILSRSREEPNIKLEEIEKEPSCREAVEILTRNPKKLSYDVNKDGVKVAVLTFTKSAYRLGETIMGAVELNARAGRARVLKLTALLETHESLPDALAPPEPSTSRHLRRVHAEHHSSLVANALRMSFSLDIPPDASPAFQVDVSSTMSTPSVIRGRPGGLEWKVRLCLFVAVGSATAKEGTDGVRLKHLVRSSQRGAWGTPWTAAQSIAPSERPSTSQDNTGFTSATQSWTSFLTSAFLGSADPVDHYHDGDEETEHAEADELDIEMGEVDWKELGAEMVECEVPIKVWPANTVFKATDVVLEV